MLGPGRTRPNRGRGGGMNLIFEYIHERSRDSALFYSCLQLKFKNQWSDESIVLSLLKALDQAEQNTRNTLLVHMERCASPISISGEIKKK